MKEHYTAYVRQVGRELDIPRRQREKILRGFQSELNEQFSKVYCEEMLVTNVGQPKEVACALLEGVDPESRRRYHAIKLLRFRCLVVSLSILLALSIGAFFYLETTQVNRADITVIQDPIPTYHSSNAECE